VVDQNPVLSEEGVLLAYALTLLGTPYRWGGDDSLAGYDCSGLVCELLQSVGRLPHRTDLTAQGLYDRFRYIAMSLHGGRPDVGWLAFYGATSKAVTHVGMYIADGLIIEAGGGGSSTTSREAAEKQNAFVRIRPMAYRKDFIGLLPTKDVG